MKKEGVVGVAEALNLMREVEGVSQAMKNHHRFEDTMEEGEEVASSYLMMMMLRLFVIDFEIEVMIVFLCKDQILFSFPRYLCS